jgi:branched-chain amino acid transport system substrate-binding protein
MARRSARMTALMAVAALAVSACGSGSGASGKSGGDAPDAITIGFISDATGAYGPVFSPGIDGAKAEVAAVDAAGGTDGHQIILKVYDTGSTAAGGQNAVRSALGDGVTAIVSVSQFIDGALPLLASGGVPAVGYGVSPNWYGADRKTLFSYTGDIVTKTSTSWGQIVSALGKTRVALVADASAGSQSALPIWANQLIPDSGLRLVTTVSPLDASDSAQLVSAAQKIKDSGAQAVLSTAGSGGAELQAALNQVGAKDVPVVQGNEYGPAIATQFGASANGLIYVSFAATQQHVSVPGVATYLSDMRKAGQDPDPGFALQGYVATKLLLDTMKTVSGNLTHAAIATKLDSLNDYDENGLIPPVYFPAFHTSAAGCLSGSQLEDGKWVVLGKQTFICGKVLS